MLDTLVLFVGRFHPVFVHLPIGLVIGLFCLELYMARRADDSLRVVRRFLLLLTLASALASIGTGLALETEGGYSGETIRNHKYLGIAFGGVLALATLFALAAGRSGQRSPLYALYLGLMGGSLVLLALGAHQGAILTHGRGYLTEYWPLSPGERDAPESGRESSAVAETASAWQPGDPVDYVTQIRPILAAKCVECHGPDKQKAELRLDSIDHIRQGSEWGDAVVPGDAELSPVYYLTTYHPDDEDFMPPKGEPLTPEEQLLLKAWINQGAWVEDFQAADPLLPETAASPEPETAGPPAEPEEPEPPIEDRDPAEIYSFSEAQVEAVPAEPGRAWTVPGVGIELTWIEPGSFVMGSPEDEPGRMDDETQHAVTLTQGFWLGKYEVTQAEWLRLREATPVDLRDASNKSWPVYSLGNDIPMYYVSWADAMDFCRELTRREREAGRLPEGYVLALPTEAQWEYACRAGSAGRFSGGAPLEDQAWFLQNSEGSPRPVGLKAPNAFGLFDIHGNVWEWCFDTNLQYPREPAVDPVKQHWIKSKVCRGGSWRSPAERCRAAYRQAWRTEGRNGGIGFRLALVPQVTPPNYD